jgi:hypothetical protein
MSENQEKKSVEKPICKHCNKPYNPNGLEECHECHELYCTDCKKVSCEYFIVGGENDPEYIAQCKECKKIYHFDEC